MVVSPRSVVERWYSTQGYQRKQLDVNSSHFRQHLSLALPHFRQYLSLALLIRGPSPHPTSSGHTDRHGLCMRLWLKPGGI